MIDCSIITLRSTALKLGSRNYGESLKAICKLQQGLANACNNTGLLQFRQWHTASVYTLPE